MMGEEMRSFTTSARHVLVLCAALLGLVLPVGPASASMLGDTAKTTSAAVVSSPAPVDCDQTGENYHARICVDTRSAGYYVTCGGQVGDPVYTGHVHIWGPGGLDINSVDLTERNTWMACGGAIGHGQTCVEFWQYMSPRVYESRGRACKDV
jgi:hypothetical protein